MTNSNIENNAAKIAQIKKQLKRDLRAKTLAPKVDVTLPANVWSNDFFVSK